MKIFCSGIGGIGVSAYAAFQRAAGHEVSGTDKAESALLTDLRRQGIKVATSQDGSEVPADADLCVFSEAIPGDSPERRRVQELGIRTLSYFQALGECTRDAFVIAVCGTHGKSTTTSMAARVLVDAGFNPSVIVGTKVPEFSNRNFRVGRNDLFVLEACEYRCSFHFLYPDLVLMTTADGDHFDSFADLDDYHQAFTAFLRRLSEGGMCVTHGSDPDCRAILEQWEGFSQGRFVDADTFPTLSLRVPGHHMQENAKLVCGMAQVLEIAQERVVSSLSEFQGTWRRMEEKGEMSSGITVIDDYAHHPREIQATLRAMREKYPGRRLVCVFQPHTHNRTVRFLTDFAQSFSDADFVVVADVYEARREVEGGVKANLPTLVREITRRSSVEAKLGHSLPETEEMLRREVLRPRDLLVCAGAGDITELAERMVRSS